MGTNCAPLAADLFLFAMKEILWCFFLIRTLNISKLSIQRHSRYLYDLLNFDNTYFDGVAKHIHPSKLQLNKANSSDTETPFLDLHLTISEDLVSSKICDKRDDFDFDIVSFPFLD